MIRFNSTNHFNFDGINYDYIPIVGNWYFPDIFTIDFWIGRI